MALQHLKLMTPHHNLLAKPFYKRHELRCRLPPNWALINNVSLPALSETELLRAVLLGVLVYPR